MAESEVTRVTVASGGTALLLVPQALASQVTDYINQLVTEENEVSGYTKPKTGTKTTFNPQILDTGATRKGKDASMVFTW